MADQGGPLGDGWSRLLRAARRRLERTGGTIEGSVGLTDPTDAERRVVIGITGRYRPATVKRLTVDLSDLDSALTALTGDGLIKVLAENGGPVRDRPAERAAEADLRERTLRRAWQAGTAREPWFAEWLKTIASDGTLTRLLRRGDARLLDWATDILDHLTALRAEPRGSGGPPSEKTLPGDQVPLPVLGESVTGDTKALVPGSPLASLVLRALALRTGAPSVPGDRGGQRALWETAGVMVDDLASQVLVLNIRTRGDHLVSGWLNEAADFGIPFRLTLHHQAIAPVVADVPEIFVCENPAVLRAAAADLGAESAPLVCTEGVPSAAYHRLLSEAAATGSRIRCRADFDWTGLRIVAATLDRHKGEPWRMDEVDYRQALAGGDSTPLTGPPAPSPWSPRLTALMATEQRAVMEERLIPTLLTDLSR